MVVGIGGGRAGERLVRADFLYRDITTRGFPEWGLHLYSNRKSPIGILLGAGLFSRESCGNHARRCITAIRLSAKPIIVYDLLLASLTGFSLYSVCISSVRLS